jgi:hypothetical protein
MTSNSTVSRAHSDILTKAFSGLGTVFFRRRVHQRRRHLVCLLGAGLSRLSGFIESIAKKPVSLQLSG